MRNQGRSTLRVEAMVERNTKEHTQSRSSQRLGAHSIHEEPKQEHTVSRGKVAGNTQEQTQSRSKQRLGAHS